MAVEQPPRDHRAEAAVLGAILLTDRALRPLLLEEWLRPEHFDRASHQAIFRAMCDLDSRGETVDVVTVAARLRERSQLDEVGGTARLNALVADATSLGAVRSHARVIIQCWVWRQRWISAHHQLAAINTDEQTYQEALHKAHELLALGDRESLVDPQRLTDRYCDWLAEQPTPGLPLPPECPGLARQIRMRPGHVTILASWSHIGKTMLAGQIAATAAHRGHKTVIWTNEDSPEELVSRHVQRRTGIPAARIADRNLKEHEWSRVMKVMPVPFGVQDCHGWDAHQVARHIRQVRPELAVLDHFHALPNTSKTEGVDDAIQQLVAVAGQTPCHLLVLSQLNQARNMTVVRPPPVARDLRGSGQMYALVHTVLLLHRQEDELTDERGRGLGRAVQGEFGHVDVAKNKPTGRLGAVGLRFDEQHLRFMEVADAA